MSRRILTASGRARFAALAMCLALIAAAFALTSSAQVVGNPVVGTPTLQVARQGHTATLLVDGRVLIIGGERASADGPVPVSEAELFDPDSVTFSVVPNSSDSEARADHTATLLADGHVLVTGGRRNDAPLNSTAVFDPTTNAFSAGTALQHARTGHSATMLMDGKLLIAGGDVTGSAELFDPATQSFSSLTALLGTPRMFHAAVLLQSGQVLLVGGVGLDNSALNSAELFDPTTQSFSAVGNTMQVARVLPTLRVLPDGKVQVIGGSQDNSMEMFDPAGASFSAYAQVLIGSTSVEQVLRAQTRAALFHNLQDGALVGAFATQLDRDEHSLTEMPERNQALVAGGIDTSGQSLQSAAVLSSSSASVTTDKLDYAPGQIVTITGRGWQAGEAVSIVLHEKSPTEEEEETASAVADANGNFTSIEYAPDLLDVGVTYTLTATGQASGFVAPTT